MNHLSQTMDKLSNHWRKRAVVNNGGDPSFNIPLEADKEDFLPELLPFFNTPQWRAAPAQMKRDVLSYAWVLYNHKTVYVESELITPVCEDLLKGRYPISCAFKTQEIIAQAMVDEAVHTQMSINAANAILTLRDLPSPEYHRFFMTSRRDHLLSQHADARAKRLVALGIACASETLVTDYLDKIATADTIQPLCRQVTAAHANDELAHSSVFTIILENVIHSLSEEEKELVVRSIFESVAMFANKELDVWRSVLKQLNFPDYEAMLAASSDEPDTAVYVNGVSNLLERTGLTSYREAVAA
nr:diiron oxygenase [Chromobacterium sp. ASV5]